MPTGLFRSPLALGMPARGPPPFFFIGLHEVRNMLAALIDRGSRKARCRGRQEVLFGRTVRQSSRSPDNKRKARCTTRKMDIIYNRSFADYCDRYFEDVTQIKPMTYDVLTRRPVPVFPFLVGRMRVFGVPAREIDRDPGGSGGKARFVGELRLSES